MRKTVTILTASLLMVSMAIAGWEFDSVFWVPEGLAMEQDAYGMHGVAVDPAGNVWFAMYGWPTDTLYPGTDTVEVYGIYAYEPDGTALPFSPITILTIDGTPDTLFKGCRGMEIGPDGNILFASNSGILRKINYQTGEGMAKYTHPAAASLQKPGVDGSGNIYVGTVGGGNAVTIVNADLVEQGTAIDTLPGLSRALVASDNGQELYIASTWTGVGIKHFHSDIPGVFLHTPLDTIGYGWQVDDTTFYTMWPEDVSMGPDGYLYAANGQESHLTDPVHSSLWFVFDPATGDELYSIGERLGDYDAGGIFNGRGAAWSADGETMYLADYGYNSVTVWNAVPDAIDSPIRLPSAFVLEQNYPNPFNPTTAIPFELKEDGMVSLKVFDIQGREVASLVDQEMVAGSHTVGFDASLLVSGLYVYQLSFNGEVSAKSMLVVK